MTRGKQKTGGADPGFSWGGGGAQKICERTHIYSEREAGSIELHTFMSMAGSPLRPVSQARISGRAKSPD